jgi:hypothetical protein
MDRLTCEWIEGALAGNQLALEDGAENESELAEKSVAEKLLIKASLYKPKLFDELLNSLVRIWKDQGTSRRFSEAFPIHPAGNGRVIKEPSR